MRYVAVTEGDKTEAELRFGVQVNTWGVNELVEAVEPRHPRPTSTRSSPSTSRAYDVGRRAAPRRRPPPVAARRRRDRARPAVVPRGGRLRRLHHLVRGPRRPASSCPGLAVQRLMAEGYGFGAEGDWKTAILVRVANVMGAGLPGGASLMEDYTYDLTPGDELILGAHMLEVSPVAHDREAAPRGAPARHRRQGRPGAPRLHRRPRPRGRRRAQRHARPVPAHRERRRERRRRAESLPKLPVGRAVWKPRPTSAPRAAAWLTAGAAHHTVMTTAVGVEVFRDFAEIAETELLVIDEDTTLRGFQKRGALEPGVLPTRAGALKMARTPLSGVQHAHRAAHGYEAVIASVGASLRSLTYEGRDLVVPFDADEVRPAYRGATLAPWPNRVVDGRYTFGGVEQQLPLTEPARGHALHGLARLARLRARCTARRPRRARRHDRAADRLPATGSRSRSSTASTATAFSRPSRPRAGVAASRPECRGRAAHPTR